MQEFEHFLRSHKQWWCHFDDDNYVNVAALLQTLEQYEAGKPWYLGKTSTASPLKIVHPKGGSVRPSPPHLYPYPALMSKFAKPRKDLIQE